MGWIAGVVGVVVVAIAARELVARERRLWSQRVIRLQSRELAQRERQAEEFALELTRQRESWSAMLQAVREQNESIVQVLRDELHMALDRVQFPLDAVAESQSERAARDRPVRSAGRPRVNTEETERTIGDVEREREATEREHLEGQLKQVEEELRQRGIDPSELSAEMGVSSAVFEAPGA